MSLAQSNLKLSYLTVLVISALFYGLGCAPGLLWQDSGHIQYRVLNHDMVGPFGLALAHPLFYILAMGAQSIPWGSFALRINLVAALGAAITVANVYLFMRLWVKRPLPALVAALSLGLSHTFWRHASIAETYTLWTALFTGELIMLLQYSKTQRKGFLYGLALLNGLALAVHMLACISLACYILCLAVLWRRRLVRVRDVAVCILLWVLGALPYEVLVLQHALESRDIIGTLTSALFGDRWQADVLNTKLSFAIVKENLLFLGLNFPTPNIVLWAVGCWVLVKQKAGRRLGIILLILMLLYLTFAFRYTVADRYAFFIPLYCLIAILIGRAVAYVQTLSRHRVLSYMVLVFTLLPGPVYALTPSLVRHLDIELGTRGDVPFRDDIAYFLIPWKWGEQGPERFASTVLEQVSPDAIVYADTTTAGPLLVLQQTQGLRADVKIISPIASSPGAPVLDEESVDRLVQDVPVYVTSKRPGNSPAFMLKNYRMQKSGLLWRVHAPSSRCHKGQNICPDCVDIKAQTGPADARVE
jgi:hypothetical protein